MSVAFFQLVRQPQNRLDPHFGGKVTVKWSWCPTLTILICVYYFLSTYFTVT